MATTELTGAFIELVRVTDIGTTNETKTVLSFTTDDVELTIDEEEASTNEHSRRRTVRKRTYNSAEVSISSLIEPTFETLDETGMIDTANDGKLQFDEASRTWEVLLLRVFDDEADASPAQVVRANDVEWQISDGITYPSDFATIGLTGWINGDIFLDYTEA